MNIPHLQTHRESAAYLFRRRHSMIAAAETESAAVARLERHLRMHLHVLGRASLDPGEPKKPADAFAALAAELSSPDIERKEAALELACQWLSEGGAKGDGAFWALVLFPPSPGDDRLLDLYRRFPPLRPVLFRLWREQGACDPAGLLDPAEIARWEAPLQEAALHYAAECAAVPAGFFRPFWRPFCNGSASSGPGVLAALWGGLLRGENDTAAALRHGAERGVSLESKGAFLRMGALMGDPTFLPFLDSLCTASPQEGVRLLCLHGTAGAATLLLQHLSQASEEGLAAWKRLTGEALPARAEAPKIVQEAERWWKLNQGDWPEGERRIAGRPLTASLSASLARVFSGQVGRDYFDQTAVLLGRPLGCSSDIWQETRRAALERAVPSSGEQIRRIQR